MLTKPDSIKQGDLGASGEPQLSRKAAAAPVVVTPCSHYTDEHVVTVPPSYNGQTQYGTFNCGYTPAQLRSAYGLDGLSKQGINGSGQTVAIIDAYASPTILKDVNTYSAANGEPGLTNSSYQQLVPKPSEFTDQALCQVPERMAGRADARRRVRSRVAPGAAHPLRRRHELRRRTGCRDVQDPRQQARHHREQQLRQRG